MAVSRPAPRKFTLEVRNDGADTRRVEEAGPRAPGPSFVVDGGDVDYSEAVRERKKTMTMMMMSWTDVCRQRRRRSSACRRLRPRAPVLVPLAVLVGSPALATAVTDVRFLIRVRAYVAYV
jgi:hypothetical protein